MQEILFTFRSVRCLSLGQLLKLLSRRNW